MLRETHIMHVAPKCLRPWPLGATAVLFSVAMSTATQVACTVLGVCPIITPMGLMACWRLEASTQVV
jgi:hypothetical protein